MREDRKWYMVNREPSPTTFRHLTDDEAQAQADEGRDVRPITGIGRALTPQPKPSLTEAIRTVGFVADNYIVSDKQREALLWVATVAEKAQAMVAERRETCLSANERALRDAVEGRASQRSNG